VISLKAISLWRRTVMMIFTIHASRAGRISITSTGRHIQNAKFANFPDYVSVAVWINLLLMYIICYIIRVASLLDIASMVSHIIIKRMMK
jgi:hypothetical protein